MFIDGRITILYLKLNEIGRYNTLLYIPIPLPDLLLLQKYVITPVITNIFMTTLILSFLVLNYYRYHSH